MAVPGIGKAIARTKTVKMRLECGTLEDALEDRLRPYKVDLPSRQYFAPTFGGYLKTGLTRGVW